MRQVVKLLVLVALAVPGVVLAQPEQAPNPYGPPPVEEGPPPEFAPPPPVLVPVPPPPPLDQPPPLPGPFVPVVLEKPKPKSRFSVAPRVSLSYLYASEDHLVGANLALDLMAAGPKLAAGATIQADIGKTVTGLTYAWVQWGARLRWKIGTRVQLGLGAGIGFLFFERATVRNDPMKAFTFGPELDGAIDLVQFSDGRALFLTARTGFSIVLLSFQPIVAQLSAGLGFRF